MMTDNDSVRLIFGLKVKALRQEKSLSYQQLAETFVKCVENIDWPCNNNLRLEYEPSGETLTTTLP